MDEERKAPAISPEPPDEGDPTPVSQPSSNKTTPSEIANSPNPKPCPRPDEAHTYTEPLILRLNGTPERLRGDDEDKWSSRLSHTELTTPSKSITSQPAARSTPARHTQPCRTQPSGQQRNGAKHPAHRHSPHTHCPHHTPRTHTLRSNGSSKRSKSSSKSNSSQIPAESQDDCCVHCILACLFCEFLTLCNIVLDCATCGSCAGDDSCFCCCCASEECGDCELPCDMDCGIIDACCESADCLEICMECCSLCFSS
ncbi:hypothetical protein CgunFtcFv8_014652 [Champsocephalus gunnari]|uniref:MyoD family inhibitor n=1 Tax=Champsocephalus gunnari TaxID=52237 RepID=A0AAN8I037_CHAGU|nr:hypothetical protein CgunFtcFv8_014652 [Champsocephalus gunnari]